MPETGDPYCSLVNVASLPDGAPILLISRLALHTKNILADPRVSLMLDERVAGDPLEGSRIMVAGRAEELSGEDAALARRRYLAAHPSAEAFVDFKDFAFFRIAPSGLHLVAGFGRIIDLKPAQFLTDMSDAADLLAAEEGAVAHMNEDHREAMNLYATKLLGRRDAADWRCTGCDPEGMDMQAEGATLAAGISGTGQKRQRIAQDAGAAGRRGAGEGVSCGRAGFERLPGSARPMQHEIGQTIGDCCWGWRWPRAPVLSRLRSRNRSAPRPNQIIELMKRRQIFRGDAAGAEDAG